MLYKYILLIIIIINCYSNPILIKYNNCKKHNLMLLNYNLSKPIKKKLSRTVENYDYDYIYR